MYGIRICLRYLGSDTRTCLMNNLLEELTGEVLTLIVADDADLDLLLVAEILVVVHFACQEGIGSQTDGFVKQEVAGTAADGHFPDRAVQQLVAHGAFGLHLFFHV